MLVWTGHNKGKVSDQRLGLKVVAWGQGVVSHLMVEHLAGLRGEGRRLSPESDPSRLFM